jgi:glycosyltransferase involved in cell wall biosynthesis
MNKKILLISNMYPSKRNKYYGIFVKNTEDILIEYGYSIKRIIIHKHIKKLVKILSYLMFYLRIIVNLILFKYDYIYAHYISQYAILINFAKFIHPNVTVIINAHGTDVIPEEDCDVKYLKNTFKAFKVANKVIVPSDYFKNILIKESRCNVSNIIVYPSGGIDTNSFHPLDIGINYKLELLSEDTFIIGYVGRIEKKKGWDVLLKAISILQQNIEHNFLCLYVGNGSEKGKFVSMVSELGLNKYIKVIPFLPQNKLAEIYNICDVFCFPTYRKSESLGLVGLEAMACGAIVIGSNMAGPASYIQHEINGLLFEPENSYDLYNKILKVINMSEDERRILSIQARKSVEIYSKSNTEYLLLSAFEN